MAVGAGVAPAFPPAGLLSTPSATILPRFACQTTIAAQSIRRKPCGQQIVKPAYSCLTIKNQHHYRPTSLCSQLADARFLRKSGTANTANVLSLEWSQINMDTRQAWIHPDQAKAGKAIALPLNDEAMAILEARQGIDARFVFTWRGEQIHTIGPAWFRARKRAGLDDFRWHDLRHTWASWHAMGGTPINVLQELGGWASPQMVQRYAHLAPGHLAQYANKLRPFGQDLAIEHPAENAKTA